MVEPNPQFRDPAEPGTGQYLPNWEPSGVIGKGEISLCVTSVDKNTKKKMVAKRPLKEGSGASWTPDNVAQIVALYDCCRNLADSWNNEAWSTFRVDVVKAIDTYPTNQEHKDAEHRSWHIHEEYIGSPEEWTKWTNNYDYVNPRAHLSDQVAILKAF
jgi:hypothetical protein